MAANPAPAKNAPEPPAEKAAPAEPAKTGGGFKAWLPVLANLVLMPVMAYATVTFLILPKMGVVRAKGPATAPGAETATQSEKESGKQRVMVPLGSKVLVNVAGTMGTRYLLANLTLVGSNPELKAMVEKSDAEMRDAAASALSVKTISDLEKPGARNLIRAELISVFNNILGQGAISDIYLTEFAIQ